MSEPRNIGEETLQEKEARLRRELEELNLTERVRDLERQIEEARKRLQVGSEDGPDDSQTRDRHAPASARMAPSPEFNPVEYVKGPGYQAEIRWQKPQPGRCNPQATLALTNPEAGLNNPLSREHDAQASTWMDHSPNLTPIRMVPPLGSHDIVQREPSASGGVSGTNTSARNLPIPGDIGADGDLTLQYYRELDVSVDDSAELLLYDMNLEELYGFASTLEENPANDVRQIELLSSTYYFIFMRTAALDDIQKAIDRAQKVVAATDIEDPDLARCLRNLIVMLMKKHECTGSLEDIDEAILHAEVMLTITHRLHPNRWHRLMDLIKMKSKRALQSRSLDDVDEVMFMATEVVTMMEEASVNHLETFKATGDLNDLEMAIARAEEAVAATPRDHTDTARMLNNLAAYLQARFELTGDLNDLQMAIARAEEAVAAIPHDHPDKACYLGNLAISISSRFQRIGNLDDLQIAIARGKEAIAAAPDDHPERARWLSNLAGFLQIKFQRTSDLGDLQIALARAEEAVAATPRDHADRAARLNNLAGILQTRYERVGDLNDLQMAITRAEEAVAATPNNHPERARNLSNSAISLSRRFQRIGNLDDLQIAIARGKEAIAATPDDHPERTRWLNNLAGFLQIKFQRTGDLSDLQMAIARGEEAVAATPHDHPDRARWLNNLSNSLRTRFEWTGDLNDLQMAIARGEEAVAAIPHGHSDVAISLDNLACSLSSRFERTGDLSDLQMAIERAEEAIAATPDDHPERARLLNNLAKSLSTRFERMGDLSDLQMAIARGEEAVAAIPHDQPDRARLLNNLANHLHARFKRMGDLNDLQMAIERGEEAMAATSHDHPERPRNLGNLSAFLATRFKQTDDLNDLQMAITRAEEAVTATPHDHPDTARMLTNLAHHLHVRFKRTGDLSDLQMAIERGEEAVTASPHDHPERVGMLSNLALFLRARFKHTGNPDDSELAVHLWVMAAELPNAPPRERINSASHAAEILADNEKWTEASYITEIAVNLLPTVAPRQLNQQDQQRILGEFDGLATIAASASLEAGKDASHAVQLLELGRGIITGLRFGTRSDLTELREQHPETAEKFEQLRNVLDSPIPSMFNAMAVGANPTSASDTNHRHNASLELEEIITQIRHLRGFKNFLLPPQVDELKAAASSGPIVLINVSKYRCDALLVDTDAIRSICLPDLHHSDVGKKVRLIRSIRSGPASSLYARDQMSHILEWLWDVAVCPILDTLGFLEPPANSNWPRIWWVPAGHLSLLPLHAAGRHVPSSKEAALDRVISSYSPSIKALLYARRMSQNNLDSATDETALLVSMAATPGHSDLRFAEEEVNKLDGVLLASIRKVKLERPCRSDILEALNKCSIFHFAGHGESHPSDPSKSSLLTSDWQENPLTVEHLFGLNLSQKAPWLAYLSACSTSESHAENLYDEAIHLVTACQLAGFQHVVGSLWEVSDRYSVDAAEEVYKTIGDGGGVIDGEKISLGVHRAVRRLRDITSQGRGVESAELSGPVGRDVLASGRRTARRVRPSGYEAEERNAGSDPLVWAAYIHVGP